MRLCRFRTADQSTKIGIGILEPTGILDLSAAGVGSLTELLEDPKLPERLAELSQRGLPRVLLAGVRLMSPVDRQEIWAAGVTYLRSKTARMEESDFSARAYNHVYEAPRPEIFFKSMPEKVSGPGEAVGIRTDAKWNVPEPELALVLNSRGELVGYTVGNDMSSRDIEGENLLYLPQAKIYERSCALGPSLVVGVSEEEARTWTVKVEISRGGAVVFSGETEIARIKRGFAELAQWLFRSQRFPNGAILLTGTGVVPPNEFTLEAGDGVRISISGIGELENYVERV
jgi:2-dehydro-3-deoxy-D-arabinonate dehydratase